MPPSETPRPDIDSVELGYNRPSDHGFKAWNYEPVIATGTSLLPTAGRVEVAKITLRKAITVSNIHLVMTTAGATLTSGQNFAGIYQNGTLVATSADLKATWEGSTGLLTIALTGAPFTLQAGDVYIAMFYNGTTAPTFARAALVSALGNANLAAAVAKFGSADTGRTTSLPATLGTISATATSWWVALS